MTQRIRSALVKILLASVIVGAFCVVGSFRSHPTAHAAGTPAPWWNGTCDTGNDNDSFSAANWAGFDACYPDNRTSQDNDATYVPSADGSVNQKWQCVELSERYLYLRYGLRGLLTNGDTLVSVYYNYYSANYPNMQMYSDNSPGYRPKIYDVVSLDWDAQAQSPHTAIVESANIDATGNGTFVIFQQNSMSGGVVYPTQTLRMVNWKVYTLHYFNVYNFTWLHM